MSTDNQRGSRACAVTGQYGKGAGLLVGERLQVQIAVSLTSNSALRGPRLCVGECMLRLVEPDPSSAGQCYPGNPSPTLLIERPGEWDAPSFQLRGGRLDVLA